MRATGALDSFNNASIVKSVKDVLQELCIVTLVGV